LAKGLGDSIDGAVKTSFAFKFQYEHVCDWYLCFRAVRQGFTAMRNLHQWNNPRPMTSKRWEVVLLPVWCMHVGLVDSQAVWLTYLHHSVPNSELSQIAYWCSQWNHLVIQQCFKNGEKYLQIFCHKSGWLL